MILSSARYAIIVGDMTSQLDAQFGRCVEPARLNAAEATRLPSTLFLLSNETASYLSRLIEMSRDRSRFSHFPFDDFAILWVVNEKGEILVALEEAVVDGSSKIFPLPKNLASAYSELGRIPVYSKLGHPALVGCQAARIAGEIICDLYEDPSVWYLNNRSGRYGVNVGRTPQQLANVAAEFAQFGIQFQPDFF